MRMYDLIMKKRNGFSLSKEEIDEMLSDRDNLQEVTLFLQKRRNNPGIFALFKVY